MVLSTQKQVDAMYAAPKYFVKEKCHRVAISTGITVEYIVHSIGSDSSMTEDRIVLIPGFMQPKDTYAQFIETLTSKWKEQRRLNCLALDNRGFGGSDSPFWRYTTRQMAEDVLALMDHLDWKTAHIIGVSMGGMISMELAVLAPQRVDSLSLLSTSRGHYTADPRSRLLMLRNVFSLTAAGKANSVVDMLYTDEFLHSQIAETCESIRNVLVRMYKSFVKQWPRPGFAGLFGQASAAQTHFVPDERLRAINDAGFPVLIVSGMQDIVIPVSESIVLKEQIPGDHVRILLFNNGGHDAACQFADEVVDALLSMIRRDRESFDRRQEPARDRAAA